MRLFRIHDTDIICSPLLLIIVPIIAVLGSIRTVLIAFLSLCVHELAHASVARRLGYPVRSIEIQPFGFVARLDCACSSTRDSLAVYSAGPLASISLAGFTALLESTVPAFESACLGLTEYNLLIACVNLLPALPLDGGRLLSSAFKGRGRRTANRVLKASGVLTGACFVGAFSFLLWKGALNPTFLIMGLFLIISALSEREREGCVRTPLRDGRLTPVRQLAVRENMRIIKALELLPKGEYAVLCILDGEGKKRAELDEARLIEAGTVLGSAATLLEAVALYGREML